MLKLTGFVLPDVGILTLTALAGKNDPAQVTHSDLDHIADYLEEFYFHKMGQYVAGSLAFTQNGGFTQPGWKAEKFKDKLPAYTSLVLRGHQQRDLEPILAILDDNGKKADYRNMVLRGNEAAPRCAFTGDPAYLRVSRDMLPMLNGRGIMNFSAMGEAGLPVSDIVLLAIHAMPLGCIITQGALLAVESDDLDLMFQLVKTNLDTNRRFFNLANQNDYDKYPNLSAYKSRLITALVEAFNAQQIRWDDEYRMPSLTAYHFSNYGSNARVSVYPLPSSTVQFVYDANNGEHQAVWQRIVRSSFTQDKPEDEELSSKTPKLTQRNFVHEDLFDLPGNAREFLRTYFLRRPLQKFGRGDPRNNYNLFTEPDLVSWGLTTLFLRSIMNMDKNRIEQIRLLGDRLAAHIQKQDDRRLLKSLYFERQYWRFRAALLRAMYGYSGDEPLVTFDGYVQIFEPFEETQGVERMDWNLSRDLLLVRIFEMLHQSGYWTAVTETLQTEDPDTVMKPVSD